MTRQRRMPRVRVSPALCARARAQPCARARPRAHARMPPALLRHGRRPRAHARARTCAAERCGTARAHRRTGGRSQVASHRCCTTPPPPPPHTHPTPHTHTPPATYPSGTQGQPAAAPARAVPPPARVRPSACSTGLGFTYLLYFDITFPLVVAPHLKLVVCSRHSSMWTQTAIGAFGGADAPSAGGVTRGRGGVSHCGRSEASHAAPTRSRRGRRAIPCDDRGWATSPRCLSLFASLRFWASPTDPMTHAGAARGSTPPLSRRRRRGGGILRPRLQSRAGF